jgi:hypothetical protein
MHPSEPFFDIQDIVKRAGDDLRILRERLAYWQEFTFKAAAFLESAKKWEPEEVAKIEAPPVSE